MFSITGRDPLIEVAVALQDAALSDEYFVQRKLYPNVDFYSGLVYRAMGFPPAFFPVLFAIPRCGCGCGCGCECGCGCGAIGFPPAFFPVLFAIPRCACGCGCGCGC